MKFPRPEVLIFLSPLIDVFPSLFPLKNLLWALKLDSLLIYGEDVNTDGETDSARM